MKNFFKHITIPIFVFILFFNFNTIFGITDEEILCNKAIVMDTDSGSVLYSKGAYDKVYPASTTKILTAILAIENLKLDTPIVVSENAVKSTPEYSSVMGVKAGEIFSVKELLYGLMLPSGNDAANVLAEAISFNIDDFVKLMNEKAKQIGCLNTNFTNPHGFHDDNHYTTPYDMALITKYALQNSDFREIIETKSVEIKATNKTDTARKFTNTNKLVNKDYEGTYYYEYATAGKTGFTDEARGTLVTYGKKDDKNIIIAVFDGTQLVGNEVRYFDAKKLFEYAFNNFTKQVILDSNKFEIKITDENTNYNYTLTLKDDITSLINSNEYFYDYNDIDINFTNIDNIINNIEIYENNLKNEKIGTINIDFKGKNLLLNNNYDLYIRNYKNNNLFVINKENYKIFLAIILTILIIILLIIKANNKIKNNRNSKFTFDTNPSRIKLKHHKDSFKY